MAAHLLTSDEEEKCNPLSPEQGWNSFHCLLSQTHNVSLLEVETYPVEGQLTAILALETEIGDALG